MSVMTLAVVGETGAAKASESPWEARSHDLVRRCKHRQAFESLR